MQVIDKKCLFSAPFLFIPHIESQYNAVMPTVFKEIWKAEEVTVDPSIYAWVMNPGQNFVIDHSIIELLPNLAVLVTPSTGCNHINLDDCKSLGIAVYSLLDDREALNRISASAEFSFLLLLNTLRRLDRGVQEVTARRWREREDEMRGLELQDKLVGIVGLGRIGRRLARYCTAFDAEVVYYDPYVQDSTYHRADSLVKLFEECDVICISCTLSTQTSGMIDSSFLRRLKHGAALINTSRGEIINESDLVEVLKVRPDLRVSLDVLAGEVSGTHNASPLIALHNKGQIVITPHIAGATVESQKKAALTALNLLKKHLDGN
jgi:D-3-phosphoglycerate dehydrogenase